MNYLKLSEYEFTVNDTGYRLGIYQDYPDGLRIPDAVKTWNDRGGEQDDMDNYGIKTYPEPPELTPGDIKIDNGHRSGRPLFPPRIWRMEKRLREYESALAWRNRSTPASPEVNYSPGSSRSYSSSSPRPGSRNYSPCSPSRRRPSPVRNTSSPDYSPCEMETDLDQCSDETLQEKAKSKNAELLPFLMRRDGEEPTWRLFAQLTISKNGSKVIYHGKYTTLAQNMKSIYTYFFGNRKHPITIGKLFKISSMEFEYKSHSICEALTPIICKSSFPLKQVKIDRIGTHPWIRTARSVNINIDYPRTAPSTQYILNLECEKLKIEDPFFVSQFSIADCIPVIEHWLTIGEAAGTCYEFAMRTTDLEVLRGIANRFNGEYKNGSAEIPMNQFGLKLCLGFIIDDKIMFKMEVRQQDL